MAISFYKMELNNFTDLDLQQSKACVGTQGRCPKCPIKNHVITPAVFFV